MRLFDSHAHLHAGDYDADRDAVIARARAAGLEAIVTAGTDLASSRAAVALAGRDPLIWATAGIHPHDAAAAPLDAIERLRELARLPRVVAIGEIGLDYYRDLSPRAIQRRLFEAQLELAAETLLPVVIHSREADADTLAILQSWCARTPDTYARLPRGVMHCYAYGPRRLAAYTALGLFISMSGVVTYRGADLIAGAAAEAPAELLLVETDCPYLTPKTRRGRRNEPAMIAETVLRVAALRGLTHDDVAALTADNARRLFRLPPVPSGSGQGVSAGSR